MGSRTAHQSRNRTTRFQWIGWNNAKKATPDQCNYSITDAHQARKPTQDRKPTHITYVARNRSTHLL